MIALSVDCISRKVYWRTDIPNAVSDVHDNCQDSVGARGGTIEVC